MSKSIIIENTDIEIIRYNNDDYISLTDMAKSQLQDAVIIKWLSLKSTIEYLGEWEILYNPNFNYTEFGTIKNTAGNNSFVLSVKNWMEQTQAIGITARAGRYGGTFAHKDIAFHFGMWLSPRFQLLLVKEYQRLKNEENKNLKLEWNLQRTLSKINYKIHTDAIKENLIPNDLSKEKINFVYADEADLLNYALYGKTAKTWQIENANLNGNKRDHATLEQLIVLSNDSVNAILIHNQIDKNQRLLQ